MDVRVGPQRRLIAEEYMLSKCGAGEDSNESILKESNPEYSLEGLMLKLKLQYIGHQMRRADSLEKTRYWKRLKAKGEEGGKG